MNPHLTDDQIVRYQEGKLSATELRELDDHILDCTACAKRLMPRQERNKATMSLTSEWGESSAHLSYETLQMYVDKQASQEIRRTVDGHIAFCTRCRGDLQNLAQYRSELPEEFHALNLLAAEASSTKGDVPATRLASRRNPVWAGGYVLVGAAVALFIMQGVAVLNKQSNLPDVTASINRPDGGNGQSGSFPSKIIRSIPLTESSEPNRGESNGVRGDSAPPRPMNTAVLSTTPELEWQLLVGAQEYEVEVFPIQNGKIAAEPVAHATRKDNNTWTVSPALQRGMAYEWHLWEINKDNKRQQVNANPAPRFTVATLTTTKEMVEALRQQAVTASKNDLYEESVKPLEQIVAINLDATTTTKAKQLLEDLERKHRSGQSTPPAEH